MGLTACRSVPLHLLLYPSCRVCQGGERPKPPSAREVAARSAGGGRDVTRFFLSPSRLRRQPPHRGGLAARPRCHSEPVTVSLAWESVLSFAGKRIATPVCTPRELASRRGLARNDKVRRGERPCPPHVTAAPCRAGPACPAGSNAYFAAGHMGPALQGGSTDSRRKKRKPLRAFFFCI